MTVYRLGPDPLFPPPDEAEPSGLLAVGGDLRPERLLLAYRMGIFPWPSEEDAPLLWFSPDPRAVLEPGRLHVPRSLRKRLRQRPFAIRMDTAFEAVVERCARAERPRETGTWITSAMQGAYTRLHGLGFAHSVEAWDGAELVGGLYGVSLGRVFFGESMFARRDDASKLAFVHLVRQLARWGFALVDCQMQTDHLSRFGAEDWPRARFLRVLRGAVAEETRRGAWRFDAHFDPDPAGLPELQKSAEARSKHQ